MSSVACALALMLAAAGEIGPDEAASASPGGPQPQPETPVEAAPVAQPGEEAASADPQAAHAEPPPPAGPPQTAATAPQTATPVASPPASPAPAAAEPADQEGEVLVIQGRHVPPPEDPLEGVNLASYEVTQAVDRAVVRPMAKTYQRILPDPIRSGIRNIINNLREPVAFLNFLLQLKPGKAVETAARFTINTTLGVGGTFDFAKRKPFNLPRRPNGLANTLGYYGVKSGPFLFLPLVGPTTVRDALGDGLDRLVLPLAVGDPFDKPAVGIASYVFSSLDQRAEFDEKLEAQHSDRADPYATTRQDYLHARQAAIDALHSKEWRARRIAILPLPPAPPTPITTLPAPPRPDAVTPAIPVTPLPLTPEPELVP